MTNILSCTTIKDETFYFAQISNNSLQSTTYRMPVWNIFRLYFFFWAYMNILLSLLYVAIELANSTFSIVRWSNVVCTSLDTWLYLVWGVLLKLLTFRMSIIVTEYKFTINVTQFALFQPLWDRTCSITLYINSS